MSCSTQQLRKTYTTHTHTHANPGFDNPFRLMLPICHSAFHCKINQYRNYTGRCIPKAQRGPLQNQVAAFQRYKIHFKKSLSLPHGNHLLSSIITRPTTHDQVFWRLHLSFNFLPSKDCSLFFGSVYQKITTNYFVIFWIDLEDLSGIYLNITTNIYVVF